MKNISDTPLGSFSWNICSSRFQHFQEGRWRKVSLLTLCLLASLAYWLLYLEAHETVSAGIAHIQKHWIRYPEAQSREKLILAYNSYYRLKDWGANFSLCEYNKCRITMNLSDLMRSDAVLFSALDNNGSTIRQMPARGPDLQDQIRVFTMMESPGVYTTQRNMSVYDNQFNWTMTYRHDSDMPVLAGQFLPLKQPYDPQAHVPPTIDSIKNKSLVAALISRCLAESGREAYITEFQKFAPLDYYGTCGNMNCRKDINCYPLLAPFYKFWFSFEGALCTDYITEKFYQPMRYGAVPVVLGSGPYSKVAPNGSYINTKDFESPEALAKYLLHLDQHHEEYLKYFDWMKYYRVTTTTDVSPWCLLCKKLHLQKGRKWYPRVQDWYRRNNTNVSICEPPSIVSHNKRLSSIYQKLFNTYNIKA